MANRFDNLKASWDQPFVDFEDAVFDTDLKAAGTVPRALYIGGAGNLDVVNRSGAVVNFTGLSAGQVLPIAPNQINTGAGTTVTLVLFLY